MNSGCRYTWNTVSTALKLSYRLVPHLLEHDIINFSISSVVLYTEYKKVYYNWIHFNLRLYKTA